MDSLLVIKLILLSATFLLQLVDKNGRRTICSEVLFDHSPWRWGPESHFVFHPFVCAALLALCGTRHFPTISIISYTFQFLCSEVKDWSPGTVRPPGDLFWSFIVQTEFKKKKNRWPEHNFQNSAQLVQIRRACHKIQWTLFVCFATKSFTAEADLQANTQNKRHKTLDTRWLCIEKTCGRTVGQFYSLCPALLRTTRVGLHRQYCSGNFREQILNVSLFPFVVHVCLYVAVILRHAYVCSSAELLLVSCGSFVTGFAIITKEKKEIAFRNSHKRALRLQC